MPCVACQSELPIQANYCPICGAAQTPVATGPTQRLIPLAPSQLSLRHGICPLCRATSVFTNRDRPVKWWQNHEPASIAIGQALNAVVTHYICTVCGYLESFVEDAIDREDIQEEWTQVDPARNLDTQP